MALRALENLPTISYDKSVELFYGAYAMAKATGSNVDIPQLTSEAIKWMAEHPGWAIYYAANGVVFLAPGLVAAPALGAAGFTAKGIAAGSAAAAAQSAGGPIVAHGLIATLQSAAAAGAGYGVPIVNGAIQGAVITSQALNLGVQALWYKWQ